MATAPDLTDIIELIVDRLDVAVVIHDIIDLVCTTQVHERKRERRKGLGAPAVPAALEQHNGAEERHDEGGNPRSLTISRQCLYYPSTMVDRSGASSEAQGDH
jgi:hypothetical protein